MIDNGIGTVYFHVYVSVRGEAGPVKVGQDMK